MEKCIARIWFKYTDSVIAYILRNLSPEWVMHCSSNPDGSTNIWITRAGGRTIEWDVTINLPYRGWFRVNNKQFRIDLPVRFCEID